MTVTLEQWDSQQFSVTLLPLCCRVHDVSPYEINVILFSGQTIASLADHTQASSTSLMVLLWRTLRVAVMLNAGQMEVSKLLFQLSFVTSWKYYMCFSSSWTNEHYSRFIFNKYFGFLNDLFANLSWFLCLFTNLFFLSNIPQSVLIFLILLILALWQMRKGKWKNMTYFKLFYYCCCYC